jgi:shikimate dehydrogenase
MDLVDVLDETARQWGAVNTIRFEARFADGAWRPLVEYGDEVPDETRAVGFNTDADGLLRSLREDLEFEPPGARVVVLGAGGAGRVAALKLAAERAGQLFLINRTREKAETLAAEIARRHPKVKVEIGYPDTRAVDLLLNATSLGLKRSDPIPIELGRLPLDRVYAVYDMVYRPAFTRLLEAARAAGCRVSNGLGMLLHQGTRALELWTGRPAPAEVMRQALRRNIYGV